MSTRCAVPARVAVVAPVVVGLAGSVALAVAMFTPAFLPAASPAFGLLDLPTTTGQALVVAGVVLSILGWLGLRPVMTSGYGNDRSVTSWAVLAIWALPLLLVPPVLSNDPYLYADQAWIIQQGANPYVVGLSELPGPYAEQVDGVWQGSTGVYPVFHLMTAWASAGLTGFDPYWGVVAIRLPAVAGVVLLGLCLPRLARAAGVDVAHTRWFCLLNPIVVVHQIGGAHNDALMIGFTAAALWWAVGGRWPMVGAPILLGLAVATKQPAAFAGLAVAFVIARRSAAPPPNIAARSELWPGARPALSDLWKSMPAVAITAAVSIATVLALSLAFGVGLGWLQALDVPGSVPSPAPVFLLTLIGVPVVVALWLGRGALVAAVLWLAVRYGPRDPWRVLVGSMLALCLTGAVLHGWYLAWVCCFFTLAAWRTRAEIALGGLVSTMLIYLAQAEYIAWLTVVGQVLVALAVTAVILLAAYGAPGFSRRRLVADR